MELTDPKIKLKSNKKLFKILGNAFATKNKQLFLVGGSVRDAFLGRDVSDLDFTTDALPDEILEIFQSLTTTIWEIGKEFGTISGLILDEKIEITTFRNDLYDRSSRNPKVVFGKNIDEDLVRRDFTVNAIAMQLDHNGNLTLVDPLDGLNDLKAGIITTPDDPLNSFLDDPLRMLRAARFVSQLGLGLDPKIFKVIIENVGEIKRIKIERVRAELDKLILGKFPVIGIQILVDSKLADILLPEVSGMLNTQDELNRHKNVYIHSLQVLNQAIELEKEPDLVLRWAALLHDIGKPKTRKFEQDNRVSFHHHEVVGSKLAKNRMNILKYPKKFISDVSRLVFLHLRFHGYGMQEWSDSAVRRYVSDAGHLLDNLHIIVKSDLTTKNLRKKQEILNRYAELEQRIKTIAEQEDLAKIRPALNGNEIMEILNIKGGPTIGLAWDYLKELRIEKGEFSKDIAKEYLLKWWEENKN